MGRQVRTTPGCWGSSKLQWRSPGKDSLLGIAVWIYFRGEVENFLPEHFSTAEQGSAGVKVGGARAAASCLDFSLPLYLQLEKLAAKFGRSLSSEGTSLPRKVRSSLLPGWVSQALNAGAQCSGVLPFAAGLAAMQPGGRGGCRDPLEQSHL